MQRVWGRPFGYCSWAAAHFYGHECYGQGYGNTALQFIRATCAALFYNPETRGYKTEPPCRNTRAGIKIVSPLQLYDVATFQATMLLMPIHVISQIRRSWPRSELSRVLHRGGLCRHEDRPECISDTTRLYARGRVRTTPVWQGGCWGRGNHRLGRAERDGRDITNDQDNNVHPEDWAMIPKCVDFLRNFAGTGRHPGQQQPGPPPPGGYKNWMLYCSINIR